MHNVFVRDIISKCNATLFQGNEDEIINNISRDTRTITKGEIFIGIKGENFNGNDLYQEAILKGAKGCILDNDTKIDQSFVNNYPDVFIVLCDDTIKTIQDLAIYKRSLYDIPIIAITGSVGKTSTKDMVAGVLGQKYNVLKTEGNLNSHIGLPLMILRLEDHDMAVLEMGMNDLGEISLLSNIARPTCAIITNVGTAHIGLLGSRENILKAKLEIIDGLDENGTLILNNDNDLLHGFYINNKDNYNIVTYGLNNRSDYMASNIIFKETYSTFDIENEQFKINVPGEHFILNALCSICVGRQFDIDIDDIKKGIETFELTNRRMEMHEKDGITIINDAYNANVDSMEAAINYLGTINNRKIAVLGDMLELGDYSEMMHRSLAKFVIRNKIDIVILVGNETKYTEEELNDKNIQVYHFMNNDDAINKINEIKKEGDYILLKASNGMNFAEINDALV